MLSFAMESLTRTGAMIVSSVESLEKEALLFRPEEGKWSTLEILHHLYDEEREDFRVRLRLTLESSLETWPPIDPAGWVVSRDYQSASVGELIQGFTEERAKSLDWLGSLGEPDFEMAHETLGREPFKAGAMLSSWVAHDLLHLRQIVATQFAYATFRSEPYANLYAGSW